MEHLNKQQIILLALLVSFVSSIATGVTVMSVMQQDSDVPVTQTINRVVERTIERVVSDPSTPTETTKETIVVRDDEAVVSAIATASKSVVRIFSVGLDSSQNFVGLGMITDASGTILASLDSGVANASLVAQLQGGNSVNLSVISHDSNTGLYVLAAEQSSDPYDTRAYGAVTLADSEKTDLGQAVVVISGTEDSRVATGIVSSLSGGRITSSIPSSSFDTHAILVNLLGEVLGIEDPYHPGSFITSHNAEQLLNTYATP